MPAVTVPVDALALGPGYLFYAPLGTADPANTVTGSVFTDDWPAEWLLVGATETGHTFNHQLNTDPVEVAEYLQPIAYEPTGVAETVEFSMAQIKADTWKLALNGGTITTTGTAATTLKKLSPPTPSDIVRIMLGWESRDNTERVVWRRCLNTGQMQPARAKGGAKALLATSWNIEQPPDGSDPWNYWTAGVGR